VFRQAILTGALPFADEADEALAAVVRGWKELAIPSEKFRSNMVPALALIGSLDPLKKRVRSLEGKLANLSYLEIDGGDHLTTVARKEFITQLRKFLEEHRQTVKERQDSPP